MERTLVLVKPDAVSRKLVGRLIARFEDAGFEIAAARMETLTRESAEAFYAEHRERDFFAGLVVYVTSGPLIALVLERPEAVERARQVVGATNPLEASPGSIRADFGSNVRYNCVHASATLQDAVREVRHFFPDL